MKRIKEIFIIFTCLLMWAVMVSGLTSTFDTATPLGSDAPSVIDDRIREVKAAVQERMDIDHYWPLTGTEVSAADAGKHRYVTFREPNDLTIMPADESAIFSKNVSDVTELHWIDESDNVVQLTSGGYLYGNNLKADSVLTAAIADANVTLALMADDSIDSDQYVDGSIDTAHIADANVTAAKIANMTPTATISGYADDSNGSCTFANGLIWKWGKSTLDGLTPTAITFAVAFPNACFQVISCGGTHRADTYDFKTSSITKTGFTISHPNAETVGRWFAVGR